MRIDAYNQINQIYSTRKTVQSKRTSSASPLDQVQISSTGYDYQIAKQAVAKAPDIREDKVKAIKSLVDSGKYEVSSEDFAAKLLEKYNEKRGI